MMEELAGRVTYERFENSRLIAEEGMISKRLYFVISGRIKLIKKISLTTGVFYKIVGYISKGESTNVSKKGGKKAFSIFEYLFLFYLKIAYDN